MGISKDNYLAYNNRFNNDEEDKIPVFGEGVLCCKKVCNSPATLTHMNKPYCHGHYPEHLKPKDKIGRYSGGSLKFKGGYDLD